MIWVLVSIALRRINAQHVLVPIGKELLAQRLDLIAITIKSLLTHVQPIELSGQRGGQGVLRIGRDLVRIGLSGSSLLNPDRPQRSCHDPVKLLVMPRFPEFETDIAYPAFKLTREMDGLQLIFENLRVRYLFSKLGVSGA